MLHRRTSIAIVASLLLSSATAAVADTRIFSARASLPDVTIDQAYRNGEELAVVGTGNDGSTLFRIDSPSTPVGCANRIEFVTSTGQRVEQVADMCVLNWDVTVEVQPAEATTETDDAIAETDATIPELPGDATFTQSVTISTDPAVTIISVSLDGDPVSITGRQDGTVVFEVAGTDEGIVCDRRVGLTLSNGSSISSNENICLNDWNVVVALDDGGATPTTDGGSPPDVPAPPEPPSATAATPSNPDMVWTFVSYDDGATLIRGVPETDASEFIANCERRSGVVLVTLPDSGVIGLAPGSAIPITFTAGPFSKTYPGTGSTVDDLAGTSLPQVAIPSNDGLWSAIISEANLEVAAGGWRAVMSLKGSARPARELLSACSQTPVAPEPSAPQGGPGIVANYFCDNGSAISVTFNGAQRTAVVVEAGAPPLSLRFVPSPGNQRYEAGEARLIIRDDDEIRFSRFGGGSATCRAQ